jgi:FkbM family methyltransferase
MSKRKILYIAPHMSTGGLPQYLYKKIELLKDDFEIHVIEYDDITGGVLVVQRNRIRGIVPDNNFYTLESDKMKTLDLIEKINPDIVHLEEMPEYFMQSEVADKIYIKDRRYNIFETSHDSSFNPGNKRFFPDKFLLVSHYQVDMLKSLGIPSEVVEYPIEFKEKPQREQALAELGLDPDYKHVINVGLFTPRKNQSEVFKYAKNLLDYKIMFHFIGNHADNFKTYWEPLLRNVPQNCKVWGERSDVNKFYEAADLFLFTSRGFSSDKETSPIVIREAIGYNVPSLIYNLDVYQNMYDKYDNIEYLSEAGKNEDMILKVLGLEKIIKETPDFDTNIYSENLPVTVDFIPEDNKLFFNFHGNLSALACIKDIDSKSCIYSTKLSGVNGSNWWVMPLPKHVIDFQNDPKFGGFVIEFYDDSDKMIGSIEKRLKYLPFKKPVMDITITEPTFMNYEEFFVDRIYDLLEISNLNVVLDVGASVGLWTKYIISRGAKKVYCFEPNKKAINHLSKSLEEDKNTFIFDKAIYKERAELEFFVDESNSITSSLYSIDGHSPSYKVNAITLEDAIAITDSKEVDLIKIDIEGAEFEIIKYSPDSVFDKINSMLIEYHDFLFPEGSAKLFSMIRRLEGLGYSIYNPTHQKVKYIFAFKHSKIVR